MAPPSFLDLGKASKDLFNKVYNFGFLKIDTTSKAGEKKEVEFHTNATHNVNTSNLFGSFEVKYRLPEYGTIVTEKWNTDNQLATIVEIQDKMAKGCKVTFDSFFTPHAGRRGGKVKLEWMNKNIRVNSDVALDASPIVNMSCVTDNNMTDFGGSLYHKVNEKVEIGAQVGWVKGQQNTRFGLATKYSPTKDWTLKAKLNNSSQIALASTHQLNQHVKLTLSSQFNLQNFNEGNHKYGLGVEYEPCC